MKPKYRMAGLLLAGSVVLASTGCSGPQVNAGPSKSESLNVGVSAVPKTLDPSQNYDTAPYAILHLASGTLTNMSSDSKNVEMALAESVESGDQEYVVKLKPDLKFSDGTTLTAADVVASFEHYMGDETNGYSYLFTPIKTVVAEDPLTVRFELNRPYPSLPTVLSLPNSAILPAAVIKGRDQDHLYEGEPMPTAGQFQIKSSTQDQITLEANPNYAKDKPSTKTVVFKKISDPAARMVQLQSGQIDFASSLSPKQLNQLPPGITAGQVYSPIGATTLVMNNRENSVLSDVRIRKALALAVNRNQINQVAFGGRNEVALGVFGSLSRFNKNVLPANPDIAAAKKLLEGTQCSAGCSLKFVGDSSNEVSVDASVVVQANLKEIGVDVTIQNVDSESTQGEALLNGNFDLAIRGSYDVTDFPDSILPYILGSQIKAYRTGYSSDKMNQLIDEVNTTTGSDQAAAVEKLNALFEQDMPMAPLVNVPVMFASRVPAEQFTLLTGFDFHVG